MNDPELEEGIELLESMWYLVAISIVNLAIEVYKVPEEEARVLRDVFLKQNNYFVVVKP
jgi:hypothetical protein